VLELRRHSRSALSELVFDVVKPHAALLLVPGADHFLLMAQGMRIIQ
jgi:hypothetical protein